jgi:hypothetical protein
MKHTQTAWAIQRPDGTILTGMIRPTRQDVIIQYERHLSKDAVKNAWAAAYRKGFRTVKVIVTAQSPALLAGKLGGRNKNAPVRRIK